MNFSFFKDDIKATTSLNQKAFNHKNCYHQYLSHTKTETLGMPYTTRSRLQLYQLKHSPAYLI